MEIKNRFGKFIPPKIINKKSYLFLIAILFVAILVIKIFSYSDSITKELLQKIKKEPQENLIHLVDRDGIPLQYNIENQTVTRKEDISPYFLNSIIISEDRSFYKNWGIDIKRIIKCAGSQITMMDPCGASTITQQYIKLNKQKLTLDQYDETQLSTSNISKKVLDKTEEILIALNLWRYMAKDEILLGYINLLYFSNSRYGIEAAAQGYFGKSARDLDLAEATFLASIPNSPEYYNPYQNFENTKSRQEIILQELFNSGDITKDEYNFALSKEIVLQKNYSTYYAPHFAELVSESIGSDRNNISVKTSMSIELHKKVEEVVKNHMLELKSSNVTNASVVILDADSGEVLVLLGSADYWGNDSGNKVNSANALRQPGSTVKPFIYSQGLEKGLCANTVIEDQKRNFNSGGKEYTPNNFDKKEHGNALLKEALGNSLNISAVAVQDYVGYQNSYQLFDSLEMEEVKLQDPKLALVLGGFSVTLLDMTNAYRVFANDGVFKGEPKFILSNSDSVLGEKVYKSEMNKKVFGENSKEIAYVISDILADEENRRLLFGTDSNLNLPFEASVKTGTSQDFRDSLAIGYTNEFVVGVWVGNNDNSPMKDISGTIGAGKIWHDVMLLTRSYYESKICQNNCYFSIEKPLNVVDTNNYSAVDNCNLGPI